MTIKQLPIEMYNDITLARVIEEADKVIKENPSLTYKDFTVELDWSNCYYEGESPEIKIEYFVPKEKK